MSDSSLPAILGGRKTRERPYKAPNTMTDAERALVAEVLDSGELSAFVAHDGEWFCGGRMVRRLEDEFCERFKIRHAVSMNSATSALHAAVAASLAGFGDEVIVPPYTMSATATAVVMCNATPVFADIREDTFCIDIEDVRRKISPRTKAIIAVNLFGGPADLIALRALADERGLILIEDNAQAPGGECQGRLTGTVGHMGIFSLNCHKPIQCGEGGVLVTDDPVLAERARLVRNHGEVVQSMRSDVPPELRGLIGYNYRLSELQAAVGIAQIRRIEELNRPRLEAARALTSAVSEIDGLTPPYVASSNRHVYYAFPIRVNEERFGLSRTQLRAALDAEGLSAAEGYVRPIYQYPMYEPAVAKQRTGFGAGIWHPAEGSGISYSKGICPVTERMHEKELLIPLLFRGPLPSEDVQELISGLHKIVAHKDAVRARLEQRTTP